MPVEALKCAWEVTSGIIPGTVDLPLTKQWFLTSGQWHSEDGPRLFAELAAEADAYARKLQIDCSQGYTCNWVRVDFIWY